MTEERAKRKLSGILSADAVGYSRLMQRDETSTIRNLEGSKKLMGTLIGQFKGRVVDAPGDNLLAEFGSVVDATECAVKIQQELKSKNADLPDNRKMHFRIGVNLGDVVEKADRIYGDGVNIAARIEGLAEPGRICISRTAYDHVKNKLELGYEYLGEHNVKNIADPVKVYRVLMEPEAAGKVIGEKRFLGKISRKTAMAAIIVLAIVAGSLIGWNVYLQQSKKIKPASLEKMAYPLPDKPSIIVLPFANMSGDPEQEYFCDGITEEVITALSKIPEMFIIASHSTFTYKGQTVKVQQVAEEMGVQYVLNGSVRISDDQVRITAQLIDAIQGHHLWSERYERNMRDIFLVQDDITMKIITALQVKLTGGNQELFLSKGTKNLQAYLKCLEGEGYIRQFSREANVLAKQAAEQAIRLDPIYFRGWTILTATHIYDVWLGLSKSPKESLENVIRLAQKTRKMDPSQAYPNLQLAHANILMRRYDEAIAAGEKAIELEPGSAEPYASLGLVLHYSGRYGDAIIMLGKAMRLNPYPPIWYYGTIANAHREAGLSEKAIQIYKTGLQRDPNNYLLCVALTDTYGRTGRLGEARTMAKAVLEANPNFSVEQFVKTLPYKDKSRLNEIANALRKAGLK